MKHKTPEKKEAVTEAALRRFKDITTFMVGNNNEYDFFQCPHCGKWYCIQKMGIVSRTLVNGINNAKHEFDNSKNIFTKIVKTSWGAYGGGLGGATNTAKSYYCTQCKRATPLELNQDDNRKAKPDKPSNDSSLIDILRFYSSIRDLPDGIKSELHDGLIPRAILEQKYLEDFLNIDSNERRLLVIRDDLNIFPNKSCVVLPLKNIPSGLSFGKHGYPEKDIIYMLHPYKKDVYIPAKNYLDELFEEKLRELKQLLNAWGAEEIKIVNESSSEDKSNSTIDRKNNASGVVDGVPVECGCSNKGSDSASTAIAKRIEIETHNYPNPEIYPYLPDNLVWYEHEEDWQRNYTARLERTDTERYHAYYKEQCSRQSVEEDKASLSVSGLGISTESLEDYEKASTLERKVTVEVKFYPMEIYHQKKEKNFFKKLFSK